MTSVATDTTIGVEFGSRTVIANGHSVKLQIWDTAGQESFRSITRSYYRGAAGVILVYDITRRDSFDHIQKWLAEVRANGSPELVMILVGNKTDLEHKRCVTSKEGEDFAAENNMLYVETSAKSAQNVDQIFEITATQVVKGIDEGTIDVSNEMNGIKVGLESNANGKAPMATIRMTRPGDKDKSSSCC